MLYSLAASSQAAVVVNWWDHDSSPARLRGIASSVVEVFCECPVEVAEGVRRLRETLLGPLGVGDLVRVNTEGPLDADSLARQVLSLLESGPDPDPDGSLLVAA